jgi:hypothetical protein
MHFLFQIVLPDISYSMPLGARCMLGQPVPMLSLEVLLSRLGVLRVLGMLGGVWLLLLMLLLETAGVREAHAGGMAR